MGALVVREKGALPRTQTNTSSHVADTGTHETGQWIFHHWQVEQHIPLGYLRRVKKYVEVVNFAGHKKNSVDSRFMFEIYLTRDQP